MIDSCVTIRIFEYQSAIQHARHAMRYVFMCRQYTAA